MAYAYLSSTFFFLLLLGFATLGHCKIGRSQFHGEDVCRLDRIRAVEPNRRVESEAGVTEYWDESQQEFRCAGVAATRHTIQPKGLLLPVYSNAPRLVYVIQGTGISGVVLPGCPESFQSLQRSEQPEEGGRQREQRRYATGDRHQKIRRIRQGDIVALPAGVANWFYNDGQTPVVAVTVLDVANFANQLDRNPRKFFLAGNQEREGWHREGESRRQEGGSGVNILSGFHADLLAEAAGTSQETVEKLRGRDDRRGSIVRVEDGLKVVSPRRREGEEREERRKEEESEGERREGSAEVNGLEESVCNLRLKENIEEPSRADVYNPHAGRITTVNRQKLPILRYLKLSAERGSLNRSALLAPHWNIDSHSIVYAIRGRARVQIVDDNGSSVFDGDLRQGQLVVVPQNFAVVKKARNEEFEWVAFKTSDNAVVSQIFGRSSTFGGLPEDVIARSYRIPREEARGLKESRGEELRVLAPRAQERAAE